ncbi:hypothetical protein AB0A63_17415 [Lentzea sp. NPDC042327]|uniref:hypothetical protein n=1 Tax=Lentzea sp. NPDC042327 TaxID=3154801 RepID=UPI0033D22B1A
MTDGENEILSGQRIPGPWWLESSLRDSGLEIEAIDLLEWPKNSWLSGHRHGGDIEVTPRLEFGHQQNWLGDVVANAACERDGQRVRVHARSWWSSGRPCVE